MVKKIISFIVLAAILVAAPVLTVSAADSNAVIGRTYVYKPTVNVELYNVKNNVNDCTVELGNEELTVESFEKYNSNTHKTAVYLLIDKSGSNYQFSKMKSALCGYVDRLTKNDTLVLITFGETVSKPITYKGCTQSNKAKIKNAIKGVVCDEQGTMFYEAMRKAYELCETESETYDRRYAIVATDGEDIQKGKTTVKQASNLYKSHLLPVFSLCHSSRNGFNSLSDFCDLSGGKVYKYSDNDTYRVIGNLHEYVNRNVLLIKAKASNNMIGSINQMLSVELNGKAVQSVSVPVKSLKDTDAPTAQVIFDENNYHEFTVKFSEKVKNAEDSSKYKVTRDDEQCVVEDVKKISDTEYVLTMKDPIISGDYRFTFAGITDVSIQKNDVQSVTLSGLSSNKYWIDTVIFYGLIVLAVLAVMAIVAVVIILLLRKKKTTVIVEEGKKQVVDHRGTAGNDIQHRVSFEKVKGVDISLTISKHGTATQIINSTVCGSIMIGRADICDICIDDNQMSRQHFALEEKDNYVVITDLETLNGTFVNSFKLSYPQKLKDGDEIIAGSCRIKFHYKNGD